MKQPSKSAMQEYSQAERPQWAEDLLRELHVIKTLLVQQSQVRDDSRDFYDFINAFRMAMQAKPEADNYPEVRLDGLRIGVTFTKLLYNKEDGAIFERTKAFEIYKRLYKQHQQKRLF